MKQLKSKQEILDTFRSAIEKTVQLVSGMARHTKKSKVHDFRVVVKHLKAYTSFLLYMGQDTSLIQDGTESLQEVYIAAGTLRVNQLMRSRRKSDKSIWGDRYWSYKKKIKKRKQSAKKSLRRASKIYATQTLRDRHTEVQRIITAIPVTTLTYHWKAYKKHMHDTMSTLVHTAPTDDQLHTVRKHLKKLIALSHLLESIPDPAVDHRKVCAEHLGVFHDVVERIDTLDEMNKEKTHKKAHLAGLAHLVHKKDTLKHQLVLEVRKLLRE